jgi:hypothetical protein
VADALEALARIAPERPIRSLREGSTAHALRQAWTCDNHLAGRLGVGLLAGLLGAGLMGGGDGRHHPDQARRDRLSAPGQDSATGSPRGARRCSARSAWTWTRCWPTGPRSGTASTGPSSYFQTHVPRSHVDELSYSCIRGPDGSSKHTSNSRGQGQF